MSKLTDSTMVDVLVRTRGGWSQYMVLSFESAKKTCKLATAPIVAVHEGVAVAASDAAAGYVMPNATTESDSEYAQRLIAEHGVNTTYDESDRAAVRRLLP